MKEGKMAEKKREAGFTLVEVIVIVAVIAIVAGIIVPMLFKQIDEAKLTRAEADCKTISSAIQAFRKDLGIWPNLTGTPGSCTPGLGLLYGFGNIPAGLAAHFYTSEPSMNFESVLEADEGVCYNSAKYKAPYLPKVGADPWGNAYIVAANSFNADTDPTFVVSAGPNGTIDTNFNSTRLEGDDIGMRIK